MSADEIACRLTKAQREEVLRLCTAWDLANKRTKSLPTELVEFSSVGRARSASDRTVVARLPTACLTPLGLAVRKILEQSHDQ